MGNGPNTPRGVINPLYFRAKTCTMVYHISIALQPRPRQASDINPVLHHVVKQEETFIPCIHNMTL